MEKILSTVMVIIYLKKMIFFLVITLPKNLAK